MNISFNNNYKQLERGIQLLSKRYDIQIGNGGIEIEVVQRVGNLCVRFDENSAKIEYTKTIDFFRAFGLLIEGVKDKRTFEICEEPQFDVCGTMLDMSRNAVMTVDGVKEWIMYMAIMGLDMLMLYTEDTYEVPQYPYMGYMRGRYSKDELKEIDSFANVFGIEVIPCIQTLGHMARYLRWGVTKDIRDTSSVLMLEEEKTYEFIENCIASVAECFSSERIHIGMDEAHDMGLGAYLHKNGYQDREELFLEHLNKVCKIVDKYNKKPLIWSDMIFRLACNGEYHDGEVSCEISLPNVEIVYWDYYSGKYEAYEKMLNQHLKIDENAWFAGGVWTWSGFGVYNEKTFFTTNLAMEACKTNKIKKVIATLWGDGGGKTNYFQALLGLVLFAEHKYHRNPTKSDVFKRFEAITGVEAQAFWDISKIDLPSCYPEADFTVRDQVTGASSVVLIYQDILLGMFDKDYEGKEFTTHYQKLEKMYSDYTEKYPSWDFIFRLLQKQAKALIIKGDCSRNILEAYKKDDKKILEKYAKELLPKLINDIEEVRKEHRLQWMKYYKPFGFEVLDIRYGGVSARISTAIDRLNDYLDNKIKQIDELEEERLVFLHNYYHNNTTINGWGDYKDIVTASEM